MKEQTLAIIKPDVVKRNLIGAVLAEIEKAGFTIKQMKMLHLSQEKAQIFYEEHQGREFFDPLIAFMTSDQVVTLVLEKENAILDWRELMGTTNPQEAQNGTIRKQFALNQRENSVHGSDSIESAQREINFFFDN